MRDDILNKKEDIIQWINQGKSKAFICKQLKCKAETLNSYLDKMGIEYKGKQNWSKGLEINTNYISAIDYLKKENVSSNILKKKLIRDGLKQNRCEICGLSKWLNNPIPLELHHKDGNHFNNELDNLSILCPNCHALQPGNSGANTKRYSKKKCPICNINEINKTSSMCVKCKNKKERIVERPSREELKILIRSIPFTKIGEKFGVSDNAIRKWCISFNLPSRVKDIKAYSDEEWMEI